MNNVAARRSWFSLAPPARAVSRSSLMINGDCFVGKSKSSPRNDILRISVVDKTSKFQNKNQGIIFTV